MCGRFSLASSARSLENYFSATVTFEFRASYNIAPTATIPVVIAIEKKRFIVPMRWGLIPTWYREDSRLPVLNNAKLETVDTKPAFRGPFKRHRCFVIADGFYEWDANSKPKQPYYFYHQSHQPLALAGIWSEWREGDTCINSTCIITEPAKSPVKAIHDRMPSIIAPEDYANWLDPSQEDTILLKKMAGLGKIFQDIVGHAVTPQMNRVAFNEPSCTEAIFK